MSKYIDRVLEECRQKNAGEPEFLQTVEEVLTSLAPVIDAHPEYEKASLLERMIEPERTIEFRVTWLDDQGTIRSTAATVSSSTAPWAPTRAACGSIPPSTCPSSSSWALSRCTRMP